MTKYTIIGNFKDEEITILVEDGGIGTLRDSDDSNEDIKSVSEVYQIRVVDIFEDSHSYDDIWEFLSTSKMYCDDLEYDKEDPRAIQSVLDWLVAGEQGFVRLSNRDFEKEFPLVMKAYNIGVENE